MYFSLPKHSVNQNINLVFPSVTKEKVVDMSQPGPEATAGERRQARKPIPKPVPAYLPTAGSPLKVDKTAYESIQSADRELIEEFTIPIRSGKAWEVPAGCVVRITTPEGPQVGTLIPPVDIIFSLHVCSLYTLLSYKPPAHATHTVHQATSISGTGTTRASASGPRARDSFTPRTSRRTTVCGRACRTCGP